MAFQTQSVAYVVLALLAALVVSFLMTPVVKSFAYKVGAIDVPKDGRRMHDHPIPRTGRSISAKSRALSMKPRKMARPPRRGMG